MISRGIGVVNFSPKGPPKGSQEGLGEALTASGRPQEAPREGKKKIEIGLRGLQEAPKGVPGCSLGTSIPPQMKISFKRQ